MDDLIEALKIFRKYANPHNPTHCEHDELMIMEVDPTVVSEADTQRLEELGFIVSDGGFMSYRYGSA